MPDQYFPLNVQEVEMDLSVVVLLRQIWEGHVVVLSQSVVAVAVAVAGAEPDVVAAAVSASFPKIDWRLSGSLVVVWVSSWIGAHAWFEGCCLGKAQVRALQLYWRAEHAQQRDEWATA